MRMRAKIARLSVFASLARARMRSKTARRLISSDVAVFMASLFSENNC
jgi:hypothetical protein